MNLRTEFCYETCDSITQSAFSRHISYLSTKCHHPSRLCVVIAHALAVIIIVDIL